MKLHVLAQELEVNRAVCIAIEDESARITTLGHVVRDTGSDNSSQTCHLRNLAERAPA